MEVRLFVVSEQISRDVETQRLSLFNVLEVINPVSLPLVIPNVDITITLERGYDEANSVDGRILIRNNDLELRHISVTHSFANHRFSSYNVRVRGVLEVSQPGDLAFIYQWEDKEVRQVVMVTSPSPNEHEEDE